ncbi:MAG: glycosyltransferase family 2 protein [Lachnospiraceae bacterium]|nr:glycosyltransferase family 2 protein [Lachnospiraceae bacterium]MCI6978790.1 glycosyltransferase family 2 protein [Lachnospiraceae bacterium]MDO4508846.1 glycosyltransferase family 2 protein [Lachnospiraceae bacterium]MDY4428426.1 glycosyltransferase family 2 protein [Lachnospiraceae bacterium]MDY5639484.1 glycosyltransferase family 2 protein [Lachnospiraceae bacterium]
MAELNELVSVIIPVYNAENCIGDTIASIRSQDYTNWEIILVDDKSTDKSLSIIKSLECDNIRVFESTGKSAARARNLGIKEAKGRYIAFLDADDLWDPKKLSKQLEFMKSCDAAFSFTGYEFADEYGVSVNKIVQVPRTINYKQALKNTTIFTSTVIFDMTKLTKEDIFMPEVKSEDTATWWKVLKKGITGYGLNEGLTLYRRSSGTLSSNKIEAIRRIWNLYRKVENLSVVYSAWCFLFWAIRAVIRRI